MINLCQNLFCIIALLKSVKNVFFRHFERPGSVAFWGADVPALFTEGLYLDSNQATSWLAATIFGPRFRSWSIPIDLRKHPETKEFELKSFKDKIRLKYRKSIALVLISTTKNEALAERLSKTEIISRVFGKLKIMIFGIEESLTKFCIDTTAIPDEKYTATMFDKNHLCLMIFDEI